MKYCFYCCVLLLFGLSAFSQSSKQIEGGFEGVRYKVKAEKGFFSKPGNGAVIRMSPEMNTITLNLADTSEEQGHILNGFF